MNNKFWIALLFCVLFLNLVSATTVWTTEGVKINQAREKIEVGTDKIGGLVIFNVTDVFLVTIPKELANETIFFSITPTLTNYGEYPNISGISGGIGELRYCSFQSRLDDSFGVECLGDEFKSSVLIDLSVNRVNIIEINSSDLNWDKYLTSSGDKMVYVIFNYILHNVAIETEEYVTLWIGNLKCDSNHIDCFNGSKITYVSIPTEYFVSGGDNHQIITTLDTNRRMFDSGVRMVYFSKDSSKDMVFSLKDTRKQNWNNIKWFLLGISVSLLVSIVANKLSQRSGVGLAIIFSLIAFLTLILFVTAVGWDLKILAILTIFIIIIVPILFWEKYGSEEKLEIFLNKVSVFFSKKLKNFKKK